MYFTGYKIGPISSKDKTQVAVLEGQCFLLLGQKRELMAQKFLVRASSEAGVSIDTRGSSSLPSFSSSLKCSGHISFGHISLVICTYVINVRENYHFEMQLIFKLSLY